MTNAPLTSRNRLLVQQRNPEFGQALKAAFEQSYQGLDVRLADGCAAAVQEMDAGPVGFCVLDFDEPGGVDLFFDLRAVFPTVRVLLTSHSPPGERRAALPPEDEARVIHVDAACTPAELCRTVGDLLGLESLAAVPSRNVSRPPVEGSPAPTRRLSGNLQILLPDLVQLKCLTGSSCILEIEAQRRVGRIYFEEGNIVHASARRLGGMPALQIIFGWKNCRFTERRWVEPPARSLQQRPEAILMEMSRMIDEAGHGAADHLPGQAVDAKSYQMA